MSKTVSFVARDELAEWLESRAEAEMKSISSVCQDIVAAEYLDERQADEDKADQKQAEETVFDRYSNQWYRPDGKYSYAVRLSDGGTKYYKTKSGAHDRLVQEYGR